MEPTDLGSGPVTIYFSCHLSHLASLNPQLHLRNGDSELCCQQDLAPEDDTREAARVYRRAPAAPGTPATPTPLPSASPAQTTVPGGREPLTSLSLHKLRIHQHNTIYSKEREQ